jgi:hypothetical protein
MPRKRLNILIALSLILFAGSVIQLIRSCWVAEGIGFSGASGLTYIGTTSGNVFIARHPLPATSKRGWRFWSVPREPAAPTLGFDGGFSSPVQFGYAMPLWLIAIVAGGVAGWCLIRRRNMHAPGSCRTCGYDLRATPDICPECGTRSAPSAAVA